MGARMTAMNLSLAQIHQWLPGSRLIGDPHLMITRVHTDSRSVLAGDLFVALKGERFDAHDYLAQLPTAGVKAAIVQHGLAPAGLMGLEVADTKQALGQLAHAWRMQFKLPLIAVTGSNGKTTVTQMIASMLQAWHDESALATQGNFNNDIGLPLTLLRLRDTHRVAVVELGMNHPGEIAQLAAWAAPSVAVVNNAQREHQEFMHSVKAVAEENGAVLQSLPADGWAVFPASDAHQSVWREMAAGHAVMDFGSAGAAVHVLQAEWDADHWQLQLQTPQGELRCQLRMAGQHNVHNAMAATAGALAAGVPLTAVAQGLSSFEAVSGRSRSLSLQWAGHQFNLVDDSYNANPDSVLAAIDLLAQAPAPRLLVLGDMAEVGDQGPLFHQEVGAYAKQAGIDQLFTLGTLCQHSAQAFSGSQHFNSMEELQQQVLVTAGDMASVLVKGSRFMRMERVVQALQAAQPTVTPAKKEASCC
jgi:UDP-N-acetylmuramoyl-tripeptide--D-alanyl-D-alanine ligase